METIKRLTFELEPHRLRRIRNTPRERWSAKSFVNGQGLRDWRGIVEDWCVGDNLIAAPADPLPHFDDPAYNCEVEREWEAAVTYFGLFEAVAIAQRLAAEALTQAEIIRYCRTRSHVSRTRSRTSYSAPGKEAA